MATTRLAAQLEAWRNGTLTHENVEAALAVELKTDPGLAPLARAVIEAYRRDGHLPDPFAARLIRLVSVDDPNPGAARKAAAAGPTAGAPPGPTQMRPPPSPPGAVGGRGPVASETLIRRPGDSSLPDGVRAQPKPASGPGPTPGAAPAAAASAPAAAARAGVVAHGVGAGDRRPVGVGSVLVGQYALESVLPGGAADGIGTVFKARDLMLEEAQDRNPHVAIKLLSERLGARPDVRRALHPAFRNAQQLSHPNIVRVQNFSLDGAQLFIVMELLDGQPLSRLLATARNEGLPRPEALRVIAALTRAFKYAHEQQIVHGDFKPSNAFVSRDGAVKVLNFGLAEAVLQIGGTGSRPAPVQDGESGTPAMRAYRSVEQLRGELPDARDDVYALAVVSYELLTGRHPFGGQDAELAHAAALKPAAVPGLARRQSSALLSALTATRDQRPKDAGAFGESMTPKRWSLNLLAVGAVALVLVVIAVTLLTTNLLERRRTEVIARELASPDPALAANGVERLLSASQSTVTAVLSQEGASSAVLAVFKRRARAAYDPGRGYYDFKAAKDELATAKKLLKDSASLREFEESLDAEQQRRARR